MRVRADERASRAGACACEAVGRRARPRGARRWEAGEGRGGWARRLAGLSVGGEEGKGPANSWARLKRKE